MVNCEPATTDKLNSIIAKAQLIRRNERITPIEMVLADLVEALARELKAHHHAWAPAPDSMGPPSGAEAVRYRHVEQLLNDKDIG